ncbi:hypothetical protein ACTWP4_09770 [Gracilibacillus sp. D59]|uniref:hypothetical protein n=1 Tax=Gracilibacillus sp. D59 TaxID=3457434 RepID=UPI003FCDED83
MKKICLIISFIFCSFTIIGCQSPKEKMSPLDNITEISISNSEGYGGLNENYFAILHKRKVISIFEEVMRSTKREVNGVNAENPDYDILVRYEDGSTQGLHLILGEEDDESKLLYIGHEKLTFSVSSEGTQKLRKIINTAG